MSSSKKLSVLVVNDSKLLQKIHGAMCQKLGCKVQIAMNGKEAVDFYGVNGLSFDLVLMDMEMPIMDGPTATRLLREMGVDSMIVGISSQDRESEVRAFMAAGLDDFHELPLIFETLVSLVQKINKEVDVLKMMSSGEKASVLIVGDDPITQRMCKRVGCETQIAKSGKEAVDLYKAGGVLFDLVLVNKEMPIMDGATVTKELRENGVESMIVGISVEDGEPEKSAFIAAGLNEFCTKPLSVDDLASLLQKVTKKD